MLVCVAGYCLCCIAFITFAVLHVHRGSLFGSIIEFVLQQWLHLLLRDNVEFAFKTLFDRVAVCCSMSHVHKKSIMQSKHNLA